MQDILCEPVNRLLQSVVSKMWGNSTALLQGMMLPGSPPWRQGGFIP